MTNAAARSEYRRIRNLRVGRFFTPVRFDLRAHETFCKARGSKPVTPAEWIDAAMMVVSDMDAAGEAGYRMP